MMKSSLLSVVLCLLAVFGAVAYEYLRSEIADTKRECDSCTGLSRLYCCPSYYDCDDNGGFTCCPYGYTMCPEYGSCCTEGTPCAEAAPHNSTDTYYCFASWEFKPTNEPI